MSQQQIRKDVYNFIKWRNANNEYTVSNNIMMFGRTKGYKRSEVGYALQVLKTKEAIFFHKRFGWVAK